MWLMFCEPLVSKARSYLSLTSHPLPQSRASLYMVIHLSATMLHPQKNVTEIPECHPFPYSFVTNCMPTVGGLLKQLSQNCKK